MRQKGDNNRNVRALTLVELVIATSAMVVILTAMVPTLAGIRNSWGTRQSNTEIVQNARVLTDHVFRHLATATQIVAVSTPAQENGYIECADGEGSVCRYALGPEGYVRFGAVHSLAALAGPVNSFQFTCYDGNDFVTPTTEPNEIAYVTVTATFASSASLGLDKTFSWSVYLRGSAVADENQPTLVPGIALKETFLWDGVGARIDSYRSSDGVYRLADAGAEATLSVNGVAADRIVFSGGATMCGDVYVGPEGDPDVGIRVIGGATVSGTLGVLTEAVDFAVPEVPAGLAFNGHHGNQLRLTGSEVETIESDCTFNKIQLQDRAALVIDGHVTILVNNTCDIVDETQIQIPPDSSVTIYVRNTLTVGGQARVNDSAKIPSALRIYMMGNNKDLRVEDRAVIHAVVENPKGDLSVSSDAQFFGKIKARRLRGAGQIHMDLDSGF